MMKHIISLVAVCLFVVPSFGQVVAKPTDKFIADSVFVTVDSVASTRGCNCGKVIAKDEAYNFVEAWVLLKNNTTGNERLFRVDYDLWQNVKLNTFACVTTKKVW